MHTGRISYKGEDRDWGMLLPMKEPPEAGRERQNKCSIAASESTPPHTLSLLPASGAIGQSISVIEAMQSGPSLLQQP